MKARTLLALVALVGSSFLASGCANAGSSSRNILVNATTTTSSGAKRTFFLIPARNILAQSVFDDVSMGLISTMTQQGYILATADDAQVIVVVDCTMSTSTSSFMTTTPVYGTVPGPVSTVNAVTVPIGSANGPTLTSGTIRNIPTVGVVGQKTEVEKVTTSTVGVDLQAYDGDGVRRIMRGSRGQPQLLWRVMGANTFRNNTIARAAQEVAMAISPFIGTNTGGNITVK